MVERNMNGTVKRGAGHPVGVQEHITREGIAPELGRTLDFSEFADWYFGSGTHREGEEPKPMMHGRGWSDPAIVAVKPANKAGRPAAELGEPRAGTEGNASQQSTGRAQNWETVTQALARIRQAARLMKKERFTALLHHVNVDLLRASFFDLKKDAAPGVDGQTWEDYAATLQPRLEDLHARVQRGAYRPSPSRRVYIPKPDGRQRPLAVAALEDKIVQRAVATVLNAIYEEDFLGFSYGFRPGRGAHDALDALVVGIERKKVSWILDADIRSFFDTINQEWLVRFWNIGSATAASSA